MKYFESHAHYDDDAFSNRDELIEQLKASEIDFVVNIGADMPSSRKSIELADKHDFIYAAVGVHPHEASSLTEQYIDELSNMTLHPKVKAIGEIGLDYHYDLSPRDVQRNAFARQLDLAKKLDMPVVIHSREATEETYSIIKSSGVCRGVIHCFGAGADYAKKYIELGYYIGIGGVITFKNAKKLIEVVQYAPLESILIETDCPYLSPEPHRGQVNTSLNLKYIVKKIADIKGVSEDEIASITMHNGCSLFNI